MEKATIDGWHRWTEEGVEVNFGFMFPDVCPESLGKLSAGHLRDGMFFTSSSVARHFWNLQHDIDKSKKRELKQDVYFIQSIHGGPIKIGIAKNVQARLNEIQVGNPYPLHIIGILKGAGQKREAELHKRFSSTRMNGEWFDESDELLEVIHNEARA